MAGRSLHALRCPAQLRPDMLRWLHASLPAEQQVGFTQALHQAGVDDAAWRGLLVACTGSNALDGEPLGAVWIQQLVGNTAVLWAPPGDNDVIECLLRGAADFVDAQSIPLAQAIVDPREAYPPALYEACGFPRLAELLYLYCDAHADAANLRASRGATQPGAAAVNLQYESHAGADPARLIAALEQTYIGTLDCPALDGVRPMDEVLQGYRLHGRHSPGDWYFVREHGQDVGVLLLTEHPDTGNWELVYIGVVPSARGRGFGEAIIRFARQTVAVRGAERIVLAVDAANAPALAAYRRVGFTEWDRRIVYARLQRRS